MQSYRESVLEKVRFRLLEKSQYSTTFFNQQKITLHYKCEQFLGGRNMHSAAKLRNFGSTVHKPAFRIIYLVEIFKIVNILVT